MNLAAQIELITVPQEFTRLCNTVLSATHGDDFLPIDDDRADRGNDGYLKSEKRMFAVHCFKRIQKQAIDQEVRAKMVGDLGKAAALKNAGIWEIENWTFLCNYPISEGVAADIVERGREHGINVSWRGPEFFASQLQTHREIHDQFPALQVNAVAEQLEKLRESVAMREAGENDPPPPFVGVPRTVEEQAGLLSARPGGWENLLFAGALLQQRDRLEPKWRDHELRLPGPDRARFGDEREALAHIQSEIAALRITVESVNRLFDPAAHEKAFGAPGEAGDAAQIEHIASRIMSTYEQIIDWAAALRSCAVPEAYERLYELVPQMADEAVAATRAFVDELVAETSRIPAFLEEPEPKETLEIRVTLVLTIAEEVTEAVSAELDHLTERG
jgi:hypothetical protein